MVALATRPRRHSYTPEDLLCMPDAGRYELVEGSLKERNMGQESSFLAARVNGRMMHFADANGQGVVGQADTGFDIFPAPSTVRFADGSFTRWDRLPGGVPFSGHSKVAPDLVLEVVSPNDGAEEVDAKAALWLGVGVRLVWVVHPRQRYVQIWRADGSMAVRREGEVLEGEDVLPGFAMPVSEIFLSYPGAPASA